MKAEQGVEIMNTLKLQMSVEERLKFERMMLKVVEDRETRIQQCLVKLSIRKPYNKQR